MQRVLIVGTSGAGKSTLARKVAAQLGIAFYASDPFFWEAGWRPAPPQHVDRLLDEVLQRSSWILDGNFERRWQDVWGRADCVVWLDYSMPTVLWQVATRNLGWCLRREVIWSDNRMTLRRAFSGIRHAARSHTAKRRRYPEYIAALDRVRVLRFSSRREANRWVAALGVASASNGRDGGSAAA